MFDIYYIILVLPAVLLSMWASGMVSSTSKKYSKIGNSRGMTGAEAAQMILRSNGIYDVSVEHISGDLSDHYDPSAKVIRLSDTTYDKASVTAVGVAAHEAGHAVQHAVGYTPIKIRTAIVPICNIGSNLAMPLILLGVVLSAFSLVKIGILAFGLATVFQLVTLPVEFNASRRALEAISGSGYFPEGEVKGMKKVLSAAAMTYVAALAVALANFIRILAIFSRRGD